MKDEGQAREGEKRMRSIISNRLSLRVKAELEKKREEKERARNELYRGERESKGKEKTRKGLTTALQLRREKKKKAMENGLGLD